MSKIDWSTRRLVNIEYWKGHERLITYQWRHFPFTRWRTSQVVGSGATFHHYPSGNSCESLLSLWCMDRIRQEAFMRTHSQQPD